MRSCFPVISTIVAGRHLVLRSSCVLTRLPFAALSRPFSTQRARCPLAQKIVPAQHLGVKRRNRARAACTVGVPVSRPSRRPTREISARTTRVPCAAVRFSSQASMASRPLPQSPSDLCLIRLSAIGDTCHTVPVVRALTRAWPATRLVWVIGKTEHSLMRGLEGVHFEVLDKSRGVAGLADLRRRLAGRRFPLLLHMHASMRANLASLAARADIRLGFDRARARDYQWHFCNAHLPPRAQQHVMDGLFEFAEA